MMGRIVWCESNCVPPQRSPKTRKVGSDTSSDRRAQASLPALAIALLLLSSVTVLALAVADGALAATEREPDERHVAGAVADRLVAADGSMAVRRNVLDGRSMDGLNGTDPGDRFPSVDHQAVRVSLDDRTILGDPGARGGTTVRRIVAVQWSSTTSVTPEFGITRTVTLPRRTGQLSIDLDPPNGTTITTLSANDRVLLRNPSGLAGQFDVDLSRFETARIRFGGSGPLYEGNATLSFPVAESSRVILAVTVDG